jgi:hypothetical protein
MDLRYPEGVVFPYFSMGVKNIFGRTTVRKVIKALKWASMTQPAAI